MFSYIFSVQKACKILAGHHDFSSFRSAACEVCLNYVIESAYELFYNTKFLWCKKSISYPSWRETFCSCIA